MWSLSRRPDRPSPRGLAPAPRRRGGAALWLAGLLAAAASACTEVQVEEVKVTWEAETSCLSANDRGGAGGSAQFSPQQPRNASAATMDTYIVEIFELTSPKTATLDDCKTCLDSRENCFLEKATCTCGEQTSVSIDRLHEVLGGTQVGLPGRYPSLYCLRVMAVQRTSEPESCECDPNWEQRDRVRLCALSHPYAASPVPPIEMKVQCDANNADFTACVGN